jgi:hypothetical protein
MNESDKELVARARDIEETVTGEAVRDRTGEADTTLAYASAYAEARVMIGDLLAIIDRLDGETTEDGHG